MTSEQLAMIAGCRESVKCPGKFEGEQAYVPYFYEQGISGFADLEGGDCQEGGAWMKFRVTAEDRLLFPELKGRQWVTLWEDSQGFVTEGR